VAKLLEFDNTTFRLDKGRSAAGLTERCGCCSKTDQTIKLRDDFHGLKPDVVVLIEASIKAAGDLLDNLTMSLLSFLELSNERL
jgi:hypothetical protein